MRVGICGVTALVAALFVVGAAPGATCTAVEQSANAAALAAYQSHVAHDRAAYFKKHKSAKQRAAFVKKQAAQVATLRAAAGCTVEAPAPEPPPVDKFTFGPGVAADQQAAVISYAAKARAYYLKIGINPAPAEIRVYGDAESAAQAFAALSGTPIDQARQIWQFATANAGNGGLEINVGAQGWMTPARNQLTVAHELFHLVQMELAGQYWKYPGTSETPPMGPHWLIEGAAELVGSSAMVAAGAESSVQARGEQLANVKFADAVPLKEHESLDGFIAHQKAAYNLYYAAADYLVRGQQDKLVAFWKAIGAGTEWHAAFQAAFGESVDQFYTEFEKHRTTL